MCLPKSFMSLFVVMFSMGSFAFAVEVPFTLEDRDRLARIEARLEGMENSIEKRFEQVDKRFEQVDKRFMELREDMNKRFEQMFNFLWILATIFTAITGMAISFALWDRRTMIRPFESKVKQIEDRVEGVEKGGVETIMKILKEFASMDVKMGNVLKKFNLF